MSAAVATPVVLPDFVVPMDPQEAETRIPPADLDACVNCAGTGVIVPADRDPQRVLDCPVCLGDGVMHEHLGGAA